MNDHAVSEPKLKRPFDFLVAGAGMLLSAPLWVIIALAIKLDDGGPIFFVQKRWGRNGEPFNVRKFRTMLADADARFGPVQATQDDPRVTRVGRVLRASGMDELPQLLSICRGDMSLVGPRALAVDETYRDRDGRAIRYSEVPGFEERLKARPGLTGMATVYLPKDAAPGERFEADVEYVRNPSLARDIKLVALSLWISVRGRWETRKSKL
jgi:lipopolysaccharide/colanic/teichoic acid biosynthesis glycosyltransferase